ncbi:proteasome assembly chaperone 1 [Orussus abietinus]|uniref:proteasome assembly chaperone 1 n=1 Tax=Orussus abietinus TaxID=222816 RepID=UPI000626CEBB|nr:proteasome assembly chaperone 1 [Orussus abietinus]
MASYFGEVVYPSSRAFWFSDEFDEEDQDNSENSFEFNAEWPKGSPTSIKTLLIIEGDMILDFFETCVLHDAKEVCKIHHGSGKPSFFYSISEDLYICSVSPDVKLHHTGIFVDQISNILTTAKGIIAVTCSHSSQYKTMEKIEAPSFLRSLTTKGTTRLEKVDAPRITQPNIVSGVCAGALSFADAIKKPATLYVLYVDGFSLDSISAKPLIDLCVELKCCSPHQTTVATNVFNKGNLYI